MRTSRAVILRLLLLGVLAGPALERTGQAYFQDAAVGVRPAGMGEAFTAVADDANAMLFNPAGLARISDPEFTGMYSDLYTNLNARLYTGQTDKLGYNYIGLAVPGSEAFGTVGASWTHFYSIFYKENTFTLSYGRQIAADHVLDVGINLKALQWLVEANDYSMDTSLFPERQKLGFTADAGVLFTPFSGMTLGAGVDNLVPVAMNLSGGRTVPMVLRGGASFSQHWADSAVNSLRLALEWHQRGEIATPKGGLELWMFGQAVGLRVGGNQDQATAGLSLRYRTLGSPLDLELDYAYAYPFKILDTLGSHRVGLTFRWRNVTPEELAAARAPKPTPEPTPEPTPPPVAFTAEDCYREALKAYHLNDWETSRQWWQRLLELEPDNRTARRYLTEIEARLGAERAGVTPAGAAERAAVRWAPEPGRLNLRLADVSAQYAPAAEVPADEAAAYTALAERAERSGRLGEALEAWTTVLALDPQRAGAAERMQAVDDRLRADIQQAFGVAVRDFNGKAYLEALRQFRAIVKTVPGHRQARFYLEKIQDILANRLDTNYRVATRLFEQRDWVKARRAFLLVSEVSPTYRASREYLAAIADRLKTIQSSPGAVQRARASLQRSALGDALQTLTPMMRSRAQNAAAAALFDELVARQAQAVQAYEGALESFQQKDFAAAIEKCRSSLDLDRQSLAGPLLGEAYLQQGILEYRQNRLPEAVAAWEQVLAVQPDHPMVKIYLQRAHNKMEYYRQQFGPDYFKPKP
jgi:tetratricopeptide (TPR) repeat protein